MHEACQFTERKQVCGHMVVTGSSAMEPGDESAGGADKAWEKFRQCYAAKLDSKRQQTLVYFSMKFNLIINCLL